MYVHAPPNMRSTRPCGVSTPSYATDPTTTTDMLLIVISEFARMKSPHIGRLAQLVRAPALQAGGPRFEPATAHHLIQTLTSTLHGLLQECTETCTERSRCRSFHGCLRH